MEQKPEKFENEGYVVETTEEKGCILSLKILVKPQAAQKAHSRAVKTINKQISIPGFRKGHAPDRTVISRYSSYIEKEWKELLVNDAYRAALELTEIYPLNKESIRKPKIESYSQDEGAVVLISYEHYPKIPYVDFSQIKLAPIEKEPISQAKIDEVLDEFRRLNADWENVEGRAVEEGDFVDVSIDAINEENEAISVVKDKRFEVNEKKIAPWLTRLFIGMRVGESREGESELDVNAGEDAKQNFKPTHVRISLHAIKKVMLPEINDALAQKMGASTLDELKDKILQKLEKEAADAAKYKQIIELEKSLLETYIFDLPVSVLEAQKSERISKLLNMLKMENLSDEEMEMRKIEIEKEVEFETEREIRLYYLNKQIAKQGKISLSNQELNEELVRYMDLNADLYDAPRDDEKTRKLVSRMASSLMQRKTNEYALSQIEAA